MDQLRSLLMRLSGDSPTTHLASIQAPHAHKPVVIMQFWWLAMEQRMARTTGSLRTAGGNHGDWYKNKIFNLENS